MTDERPEPDEPVTYLHIGTMKSGTSYLQDVLDRNRDQLAVDGVAYLGRGTRAVWDVLELRESKADDVAGAWDRLARQTRRSSSPVRLLSMEMLSTAQTDDVVRIVESLGQVRVLVTARDLARTVPSAWQNVVKHGSTTTYEEFVAALLGTGPARVRERFWRQHDLAAIVGRWAGVVGPDAVSVVTVPPSGASSTLLWERFCEVLGVAPARYDATSRQTSNVSLPYSDAELLRQVNARLGGVLSDAAYNRYVRTFLANELMRPRPADPSEPPAARDVPALGADGLAWATEQANRAVRAVSDAGVHVVGDLADLVPAPAAGDDGSGPATPPAVIYPETVVRAMVQLLRKIADLDPDGVGPPSDGAVSDRKRARLLRRGVLGAAARDAGGSS